ncbi:hypothetical protein [Streptomyces sp900116325]|uniref:Uncharacterized protein n=1 Tax=Streptomyces sp. 900116325 TaxID=3154295 RepID=A0ABV2UJL2_9ACTN
MRRRRPGNRALRTDRLLAELAGTGVSATVVCPGRVATEWSGGQNQNGSDVMSARDVATATALAVERGDTVCVPGLAEAEALERLLETESALVSEGNRSVLADRYQPGF